MAMASNSRITSSSSTPLSIERDDTSPLMEPIHHIEIELIGGLPEDIALECLARLSYTAHGAASRVCRRWRRLLRSREFYHHRQRSGFTRKVACLVQALPTQISPGEPKSGPGAAPTYGVSVFDPVAMSWDWLEPAPYPNGLPLFCQLAGCEGKLLVLGGWDPASYEPVSDVFAYDFTACRWERRAPMPAGRSFFAAAGSSGEGRIYVAGGHDEAKNAMRTAWAYDVRGDKWDLLPEMGQERDECEGVVIGREFWVVSGYGTESQGEFQASAEAYGLDSGEWRRIDCAWRQGQCPRSCLGANTSGGDDGGVRLASWADAEPEAGVGTCGVEMGEWTLVTGAQYQGGPQGFYTTRSGEGQNGKYVKMGVPEEFSGFVQSGCCVEI